MMLPSRPTFFLSVVIILCLYVTSGNARRPNETTVKDVNSPTNVEALKKVSQTSYDAVNRWMMMRRDLLNITIDTDKIDEEPLTASDLLLRAKLMAYVQKLVDKEEKKKLKDAKKAEKVKAKAALLGLPPSLWAPPAPVTVSPPFPIETSVNLSGSEPLPPPGFWLYKKAQFLTKLFSALADAAATLPGVTTEAPPTDDETDTISGSEETTNDESDSIVNVNDKRSLSSDESDEDEYDSDDTEVNERIYVEGPATKMVKSSKRKPVSHKYHEDSKKSHGRKPLHHHKFHDE